MFSILKQVQRWEMEKWLRDFPNMTAYQKGEVEDYIAECPYVFYKYKEKVDNKLIRLTIVLLPIVFISLSIGLPFNFILTGRWGYGKIGKLYGKWIKNLGV